MNPLRYLVTAFVLWGHLSTHATTLLPELTYMSPTGNNVTWPKLPIKICVSKNIPPAIREELPKAAAVWNESLATKIFDVSCSVNKNVYQETEHSVHGVYWITRAFEKFTDKTSLARTVVQYDDSGAITDADILLNGEYYNWSQLPIDAQTVFIHELGHVLGLKHLFLSLDSAMNYYPYVAGYQHRSIGAYERFVFNVLYKKEKISTPTKYLELYFSNHTQEAVNELEKITSESLENFYALGVLYRALKQPALAQAKFAKALELRPQDSLIRYQFADALWAAGEVDKAEKEFLQVLSENPKSYEALANLGSLYLTKGQTKKGIEYLQKSLAVQPAHWVACQLLFNQTKEQRYRKCVLKYGP